MKKILLASLIGLAAVGCQNNNKPAGSASLTPAKTEMASPAAMPTYTPPPPVPVQQPVIYDTPVATSTPADAPAASAKAGGSYKIQKGDTLFAIAKKTYGDGKAWKKIEAANPGVTASSLKVGQTIKLP